MSNGPLLRVSQVVPFRATAENLLTEATTAYWHGISLPNAMDDVPGVTRKPFAPGERFDCTFTPPALKRSPQQRMQRQKKSTPFA